jgi:AraC-like DNA-binding protein
MTSISTDESHTTLATWALAIERALVAEGHDPAPLFALAGIDRALINNTEARLPIVSMWALWRSAVEQTNDDAFGISVAEHVFPTHLNALLFAIQSSQNLRDIIDRLIRYATVVSTIIDLSLIEDPLSQQAKLRFTSLAQDNERPHAPFDAFLAIAVKNIRDVMALGEEGIIEIHLRRPEPENLEKFQQFFNRPIRFNCEHNDLVFAEGLLDKKLAAANADLARINDQLLDDHLKRLNKKTYSLRVKEVILDCLPDNGINQELAAKRLNMSVRNLHRKLAEENTSFKVLLDTIRHDLSRRYLKNNMSISDITYSLGFVDQSSFSRAFKRWTGQSPSQYRKDQSDS